VTLCRSPKKSLENQLIVKVLKSPINPSDLLYINGTYNPTANLPLVPGFEAVAVVLKTGAGVSKFKAGDRIAFFSEIGGIWEEIAIVYENYCLKVNPKIPLDQAAQMTLNPLTAYGMIKHLGIPHHSGQYLLQSAAGCTVGRIVIQLSKILGFKTINLVRREEQIQEIKDLGGDYVWSSSQDFVAGIMELTNGKGVKYAIDPVGGELTEAMGRCLSNAGYMLVYGTMSEKPTTFPANDFFTKNLRFEGFHICPYLAGPHGKETTQAVTKLYDEGKLNLPVFREYPLENFQEAIKEATNHERCGGKVLFSISQPDEA